MAAGLPRESEFAFTTLRGSHYRPSSRSYQWNRVRCAAGFGNVEHYTATRHYFGWYALNVLVLEECDDATIDEAAMAASCLAALAGDGHQDAALTLRAVAERATSRLRARGVA